MQELVVWRSRHDHEIGWAVIVAVEVERSACNISAQNFLVQ